MGKSAQDKAYPEHDGGLHKPLPPRPAKTAEQVAKDYEREAKAMPERVPTWVPQEKIEPKPAAERRHVPHHRAGEFRPDSGIPSEGVR
jgi:hypothetical protein